jgi:prepilin-type N-terminal cleavage/methylation domain-containing protein
MLKEHNDMDSCKDKTRLARKQALFRNRAFTLIELLIVILIIAILSAPTTVIIYVMHTTKGDEIEAGLRSQLCLASRALIQDIKNARAQSDAIEGFRAAPDTLILEQTRTGPQSPEYVIYYFKGDRLFRRVLFGNTRGGVHSNETALAESLKGVNFSSDGRLVTFSIEAGFTYDQRPYSCSVTSAAATQAAFGK